jgi:hypothetical protein
MTTEFKERDNILNILDVESRILSKYGVNFYNVMAYIYSREDFNGGGGGENKNEYKITLTIGQMNLVRHAIMHFQNNILGKRSKRWCELTRDSYNHSGCTKENCDSVRAKILEVQLDIYEQIEQQQSERYHHHETLDR